MSEVQVPPIEEIQTAPKAISYNVNNNLDVDLAGNITGYDSLREYAEAVSEDSTEKTEADVLVELYAKISGYFQAISYLEFEELPIEVIEAMDKYINRQFEKLDEPNNIFSIRFLEVLLAIGRAFGGKK